MQDQFQDADKGYNSGAAGECAFFRELRLESPIAASGRTPKLQRKRANITRVIDRTNCVMPDALYVSYRYHFVRAGRLWHCADSYYFRRVDIRLGNRFRRREYLVRGCSPGFPIVANRGEA